MNTEMDFSPDHAAAAIAAMSQVIDATALILAEDLAQPHISPDLRAELVAVEASMRAEQAALRASMARFNAARFASAEERAHQAAADAAARVESALAAFSIPAMPGREVAS